MSHAAVHKTKMGRIVVTLTLTNWADRILSERGFIPVDEVRTYKVDNALVDTGATRLCLPADIIQKLGLTQVGTIDAKTAVGTHTVQVYEGLELTVEGRKGRYDCVALPPGQTPLLGLIPLEDLGLNPDLQAQKLIHLPTIGKETYMTIL